jgi:hypothetical protein
LRPEIQAWLNEAGYENHCFISWPHIDEHEVAQCARLVRKAIQNELKFSVPDPQVFLDETALQGGDIWREELRRALCRSVSMVAICAPIYYHPSHPWCGREWAAMEALGEERVKEEAFRTIIPIILRERGAVPAVVSKFQYIDFSKTSVQGRHYYATREFRLKITEVVSRIEQIATALFIRKRLPECDGFAFPEASAFAHLGVAPQNLPFRE